MFAVRVPKRGCGLIIPSPMYSLSVTGPPTGTGGTEPSSPKEPSRGNADTVGAISFSWRTVKIRFLRSLMFRSTRRRSVEKPVYGRFGVASTIQAPYSGTQLQPSAICECSASFRFNSSITALARKERRTFFVSGSI